MNEENIVCNPADWATIQKVLHGDYSAFERLMMKYQGMVFAQAIKAFRDEQEAEDFTQEIFLKAFEALSTFKGQAQFSTWLFTIARNEIIRRYKKKYSSFGNLEDSIEERSIEVSRYVSKESSQSDPEKLLMREEFGELMRKLVERLPEAYRHPISLHYFENMSYKEIAKKLNLKMNTLKSYIFRGKELIKNWIEKDDAE